MNKIPATLFILASTALLIAACSTVSYNPTVYDYHFDRGALAANPIKKVLIASVNVSGRPTLTIVRDNTAKIDAMIEDYLKDNGYQIAPSYLFDNAWKQALYTYGDFYDPTTGKVDQRSWMAVMSTTLNLLKQDTDVDAVLFTDVIVHDVQHSAGLNHYARWYGVTRKPATQGAGSGVPTSFNWTQPIKAASLAVTIYDMDGDPLFSSRGGLDTLYAVNMRNPDSGFTRRKNLLDNNSNLKEGIQLALHPFIPMKRYPGKKASESEME